MTQRYNVNDIVNNLKVLEDLGYVKKYNRIVRSIKCLCFCGKEFITTTNCLKRTISCGCHIETNFVNRTKYKPGDIVGRITILSNININRKRYVNCKCNCGNEKIIKAESLASGVTKSCGCLNRQIVSEIHTKYNIDDKFGNLTIKNIERTKGHYAICLCDCGNYRRVEIRHLINEKITSCKKCNKENYLLTDESWQSEYNKYFKDNSIDRKIEWSLNLQQFISFAKGNCYYCNKSPHICTISNVRRNSIDRVDNSKGYSLDNCVSCCAWCNAAKSNKTLGEFIGWIKKVHNNLSLSSCSDIK